MKDILIVGNFLSKKVGNHSVCEDLAFHLESNSWNVIRTSGKTSRIARLFDMVVTCWRKRHQFSVAQVDVYSGRAFIWAEAVCYVLRFANKPYVLTLHGGELPSFAMRHKRRVSNLLTSASGVTTPSRYLLERMGFYRADIWLVPNPLTLERYKFREYHPTLKPKIIWLRAFHTTYNPMLAIKVVAHLCAEFPEIELTMIGPDKGDGSLQICQYLSIQLGISNNIKFIKGVDNIEVPNWLSKGDIFINTTNVDNTPISVLEAMACGLCVVSTNVGGIPYLLEDKKDSLLVPPDNVIAMSEAIKHILTDPSFGKQLSTNAGSKVRQYDWSVIFPLWEDLLLSVI